MKTAVRMTETQEKTEIESFGSHKVKAAIHQSWNKLAPTWPLKNLVAVNPLCGFEGLSFEEALCVGQAYFQAHDLPKKMQEVNRHSIKWLQAFFDDGQATICMPLRHMGLYASTKVLLSFDDSVMSKHKKAVAFLDKLPQEPEAAIAECLLFLGIRAEHQAEFLTLMLTTLSGWAAYIKYRTQWTDTSDVAHPHPVTQEDYLAFRLVLTCLIWPQARTLLDWHNALLEKADIAPDLAKIQKNERTYRNNLLQAISPKRKGQRSIPDAQLIFCIDVRSEPFRRALEARGNYETFGFAGFFGVPVNIQNAVTGESYASCPVLLKPAHTVIESPACNHIACHRIYERSRGMRSLYQSLKYNFTTPFTLVEVLGPLSGIWMGFRSFFPSLQKAQPLSETQLNISAIPFKDKVNYAFGMLRIIGLTKSFAPLVVICGHASQVQNNAYATALDCGACGGHGGAPNAKIMAAILNNIEVRKAIAEKGIIIPDATQFIAAQHNTTTDEVTLYHTLGAENSTEKLYALQNDLQETSADNSLWRYGEMDKKLKRSGTARHAAVRAQDWAQIRPEWGLARNAAFIVGPRELTKELNLQGRSFLHSYDYMTDQDGSALTVILTAPMVVAHWISSQYFFSTYDNVAYGGGNKVSQNITGKIGIMQGNASDLMHGLPLQSVNSTDQESYHTPLRLLTIIYAPRTMIDRIIVSQEVLQKLFGNGWVTLVAIEPKTGEKFILGRDFGWQKYPSADL